MHNASYNQKSGFWQSTSLTPPLVPLPLHSRSSSVLPARASSWRDTPRLEEAPGIKVLSQRQFFNVTCDIIYCIYVPAILIIESYTDNQWLVGTVWCTLQRDSCIPSLLWLCSNRDSSSYTCDYYILYLTRPTGKLCIIITSMCIILFSCNMYAQGKWRSLNIAWPDRHSYMDPGRDGRNTLNWCIYAWCYVTYVCIISFILNSP